MTDTTTTAPPAPPPPTKEQVVAALKGLQKTLTAFPGPKPDLEAWMKTLQEAIDYINPPPADKTTKK